LDRTSTTSQSERSVSASAQAAARVVPSLLRGKTKKLGLPPLLPALVDRPTLLVPVQDSVYKVGADGSEKDEAEERPATIYALNAAPEKGLILLGRGYRKSYPGWRRCRDGLSSLWDA